MIPLSHSGWWCIDVTAGYNGTVFAYGQTGSGKTYTMMVCMHIIDPRYAYRDPFGLRFFSCSGRRYRRWKDQRHYTSYRWANLYQHHGIAEQHWIHSASVVHGNLHGASPRFTKPYVVIIRVPALDARPCFAYPRVLFSYTASRDNLPIHEDKQKGIYVKDLLEVYVGSSEEVYEVMRRGGNNRVVAYTSKVELYMQTHHPLLDSFHICMG